MGSTYSVNGKHSATEIDGAHRRMTMQREGAPISKQSVGEHGYEHGCADLMLLEREI
jgi:hypothetical protein